MSQTFPSGGHWQAAFSSFISETFTIVVWIKKDAAEWTGGADYIFALSDNFTDDDEIHVCYQSDSGNDLIVTRRKNTSTWQTATASFTANLFDDLWVPIIYVVDGASDATVYVGSSAISTQNTGTRNLTTMDSLRFGRLMAAFGAWVGHMGDAAIFDSAWSTTLVNQVQTSAETGPALSTIDPTNCRGYWSTKDDEATYSDLGDNSGPDLVSGGAPVYSSDHHTITGGATGSPYNYYAQQQIG